MCNPLHRAEDILHYHCYLLQETRKSPLHIRLLTHTVTGSITISKEPFFYKQVLPTTSFTVCKDTSPQKRKKSHQVKIFCNKYKQLY